MRHNSRRNSRSHNALTFPFFYSSVHDEQHGRDSLKRTTYQHVLLSFGVEIENKFRQLFRVG